MNKHIVLGVGGGIAAYKACELLRRLREAGHDVRVIPTDSALRFVGAATFEALSGHPVTTSVFDNVDDVAHVKIAQQAKLMMVAPATANLLAKAATGQADDLLTSTLLMASAPVIFAPAMHTEMWSHAATIANVKTLRARGALVLDPAVGRLTGSDSGPGRLPEPTSLVSVCEVALDRGSVAPDMAGLRVLISAGGTREPLDPVRFLGNRSSGKQGWALATAAVTRGAEVEVVAANVDMPDPAGVTVYRVSTAAELRDLVIARSEAANAIVMAAAVADFRPVEVSQGKIKKSAGSDSPEVRLTRTVDILAELGSMPDRTGVLVGFAAETVDSGPELVELGSAKRADKGADLIVANTVGVSLGFESDLNSATIIAAAGVVREVPTGSKASVANAVWDAVLERLPRAGER